jgi:hypothetical protein
MDLGRVEEGRGGQCRQRGFGALQPAGTPGEKEKDGQEDHRHGQNRERPPGFQDQVSAGQGRQEDGQRSREPGQEAVDGPEGQKNKDRQGGKKKDQAKLEQEERRVEGEVEQVDAGVGDEPGQDILVHGDKQNRDRADRGDSRRSGASRQEAAAALEGAADRHGRRGDDQKKEERGQEDVGGRLCQVPHGEEGGRGGGENGQ